MSRFRTTVVPDSNLREPRKKRVIVLEDVNFVWDEPELKELRTLWRKNFSIQYMAEYFDRDADEVLLALIHLARNDKITGREGGLFGTK